MRLNQKLTGSKTQENLKKVLIKNEHFGARRLNFVIHTILEKNLQKWTFWFFRGEILSILAIFTHQEKSQLLIFGNSLINTKFFSTNF